MPNLSVNLLICEEVIAKYHVIKDGTLREFLSMIQSNIFQKSFDCAVVIFQKIDGDLILGNINAGKER